MDASIQICMTGLSDQDYMAVNVAVIVSESYKTFRYEMVYEEKLPSQDLGNTMSVQQWALATISNHVDAIRSALARDIERGIRKVRVDLPVHQKDLVLGAWSAPPRPAKIGPRPPFRNGGLGSSFWLSPRASE